MITAKKLTPSRFGLAEHKRNIWHVSVDASTTLDEIRHKEFWSHIAYKLRPLDQIEVITDDASEWHRLLVVNANKNEAIIRVIDSVKLDESLTEELKTGYEVKFAGPVAKHRIIRRSDGQVIEEGIATKEEAYSRMNNLQSAA